MRKGGTEYLFQETEWSKQMRQIRLGVVSTTVSHVNNLDFHNEDDSWGGPTL